MERRNILLSLRGDFKDVILQPVRENKDEIRQQRMGNRVRILRVFYTRQHRVSDSGIITTFCNRIMQQMTYYTTRYLINSFINPPPNTVQ